MGKLKTHKSTIKRFKVTKSGKLSFNSPAWNHLKSKKNARVKYRKNATRVLAKGMIKNIKKSIPGISNA